MKGAAQREMRRRCRANRRYAASASGASGAQPVGCSTQPRPAAAYARRSTSTPRSIDPSGSRPWISAFIASSVAPYRAASKPGAAMSTKTSLPSRLRSRRWSISSEQTGQAPS